MSGLYVSYHNLGKDNCVDLISHFILESIPLFSWSTPVLFASINWSGFSTHVFMSGSCSCVLSTSVLFSCREPEVFMYPQVSSALVLLSSDWSVINLVPSEFLDLSVVFLLRLPAVPCFFVFFSAICLFFFNSVKAAGGCVQILSSDTVITSVPLTIFPSGSRDLKP